MEPLDEELEESALELPSEPMQLNMGPSHPAMHGTVRIVLELSGETITKAVHIAIRERLQKVRSRRTARRRLADRLDEIARHCAALPVLRDRSADEILGYDERGLPG